MIPLRNVFCCLFPLWPMVWSFSLISLCLFRSLCIYVSSLDLGFLFCILQMRLQAFFSFLMLIALIFLGCWWVWWLGLLVTALFVIVLRSCCSLCLSLVSCYTVLELCSGLKPRGLCITDLCDPRPLLLPWLLSLVYDVDYVWSSLSEIYLLFLTVLFWFEDTRRFPGGPWAAHFTCSSLISLGIPSPLG